MKENWRIYNKSYREIQEKLNIAPLLAKLVANRCPPESAAEFLDKEGPLADPFRMRDAQKAAEIILRHVEEGDRIEIIGDYDVDGMTSSVIWGQALRKLGANVHIRIPDRVEDGYGIRPYMVEECVQKKTGLIVTCDNGIREFEAAAKAKELGISLIITDHHEIDRSSGQDRLPEAEAIVNPHRGDDESSFKMLCGAGVSYQMARALMQKVGLREDPDWIGYAALGTVCDVMPLLGENRKLVYQGLKQWNCRPPQGIRALMKLGGIETLDVYTFGFVIGPMINSGGRLECQQRFLPLLLEQDPEIAEKGAARLFELNRQRQQLTEQGIMQGLDRLEQRPQDKVQVIYLPELHESLAGLVAGRLREKCHRPVFVLTGKGEGVKGSGRSIPAYDMFVEMSRVSDCFERYGGHPMAAGLSMREERIGELRSRLNEQCGLREEDLRPTVYIDMAMPLEFANEETARMLEWLEPYGTGNPKPVFADKGVGLRRMFWMGHRKKAVRLVLEKDGRLYEGIHFRPETAADCIRETYGEELWNRLDQGAMLDRPLMLDLCYQVGWNVYRGRRSLQIVITNMRCSLEKA